MDSSNSAVVDVVSLPDGASSAVMPSVITSKAAIYGQSKTGQRSSSETELFLPLLGPFGQVI